MHVSEAAVIDDLNQFLRRLRQYQTEGEWASAILDAASNFVSQIAVFIIQGRMLRLCGQSNLDLQKDLTFPISSAAAFRTAIDSQDPVIALRTAAELTAPLSTAEPGDRAHIIPILNGSRTVAILFAADHHGIDLNALELIGGMASLVLERQANLKLHAQLAPLHASEKSP